MSVFLSICGVIPVFASQVKKADINYSITYSTNVIGSAEVQCDRELNPRNLESYQGQFNVDITDMAVTSAVEKYKQKALAQIDASNPNSIVDDRWLRDGYEYAIPTEAKYYFRFFELPQNYKGTKVIVKEGVPFTVTGDGNGNLSMKIATDVVGTKTISYTIPEERTCTLEEGMVWQKFHVTYRKINSVTTTFPNGSMGSYEANTLEEALEHCRQYADLEKSISIFVTQEYRINYYATMSDKVELNVTYGNSSGKTEAQAPVEQETPKTGSDAEKLQENVKETVSAEEIQIENETQQEVNMTGKEKEETEIKKEIVSENEQEDLAVKKNTKVSIKWIVILCILIVSGVGSIGILVVKKLKKTI